MAKQVCTRCGRELPKTSEYFYKYSSTKNKFEPGLQYHSKCKQCEREILIEENWKDGLLKCHVCERYFPEEYFHKIGTNDTKYHYRNHRDNRCPECKKNQNKEARARYSDDTALRRMLNMRRLGAKDRAKRLNINFDLDINDLLQMWENQKGLCSISGIPMTYSFDNGRTFTNVSIDQINPHQGYTIDNTQLVCMTVNQMKSDMSLEELYMFCEAILKNKK